LKHVPVRCGRAKLRRAPRGARGLKPPIHHARIERRQSRPARGAWIETFTEYRWLRLPMSRPARGAWIETGLCVRLNRMEMVAPRAGRVD